MSLLATWGPLIVAGGAVVGAFMLWKKHTDDVKKALELTKKATQDLTTAQAEATEALGQASAFAEKYKASSDGLTKSLDGLLMSQNAAYRETLAGIGATDEAGRAAVRRAELERLLTVNILRRAAAEAEARAQTSKDAAKVADRAAFGSGLITAMGMAGSPDAIAMGQSVQADKFRKLGGEAAEKAAKQEMEYAKSLKASADELLRAKLTIPEVNEKRSKGLSDAEKAAKRAATEVDRAKEATADYIKTLEQQLQAVGQTSNAIRRLAADREIELALQRGDTESAARIRALILETEKMEDLAKALEEATDWRKKALDAANAIGPLTQAPTNAVFSEADRLQELVAVFEEARHRADEVRYAVDDIYYAIRNNDWTSAFAGLFRVLDQLKKAFRDGTTLDKVNAAAGLAQGVGGLIGGKAGGALSGAASAGASAFAMTGNPLIAAGAAIIGGVTGWLSGNKAEKAAKNAEALKRAEEELARVREIAATRRSLEIDLMELQGNAAGALAARQKDQLQAMDASLRPLQELVWAEQKLTEERQKAVDTAQQGVDDARNRLSEAYSAEAGALQEYIDRFKGWSGGLNKFLKSLYSGPSAMLSPEEQYRTARATFDSTSAAAAGGDENAIRDLESVSQAYLDASKDYYASSKEYFADLDRVRAAVSATQAYAAAQVDVGQAQLTALNASVSGIITVNNSVLSVRDALAGYQAAIQQLAAAQAAQQAANDNAVGGGAAKGADWSSYIANNSDVAAEYLRNMASAKGRAALAELGATSIEKWGEIHWNTHGKAEGRTPYAAGGIMDRPIALGETGIGGEAGPEGILPLANVGGKMGVHAVGQDNGEEKALLRELIAKQDDIINELRADKAQRAAMAEEQQKQNKRIEDEMARASRTKAAA